MNGVFPPRELRPLTVDLSNAQTLMRKNLVPIVIKTEAQSFVLHVYSLDVNVFQEINSASFPLRLENDD